MKSKIDAISGPAKWNVVQQKFVENLIFIEIIIINEVMRKLGFLLKINA